MYCKMLGFISVSLELSITALVDIQCSVITAARKVWTGSAKAMFPVHLENRIPRKQAASVIEFNDAH